MVIAVGSSCSHMIKMDRFRSGEVAGPILADLESNRSNFDRARKSDPFVILTMYRVLYPPLYPFYKHSLWWNPRRIRNLVIKTTVSKYLRSGKNVERTMLGSGRGKTDTMSIWTWHWKILHIYAVAPSHQIALSHSFFGVERRWRALHQYKGPSGHNER